MNEKMPKNRTEEQSDVVPVGSEVPQGLARVSRFVSQGPSSTNIHISADAAENIKAHNDGELPKNVHVKSSE